MPQRPYLPLGSLRAVLAYPDEAATISDAAASSILDAVGLARLTSSLDVVDRWDRNLSADEQQALAFARIALQAPKWVICDNAMSALHDDMRHRICALLAKYMSGATLVLMTQRPVSHPFITRTLTLRRLPAE
jgi:putative ATP-binding cassette transporter